MSRDKKLGQISITSPALSPESLPASVLEKARPCKNWRPKLFSSGLRTHCHPRIERKDDIPTTNPRIVYALVTYTNSEPEVNTFLHLQYDFVWDSRNSLLHSRHHISGAPTQVLLGVEAESQVDVDSVSRSVLFVEHLLIPDSSSRFPVLVPIGRVDSDLESQELGHVSGYVVGTPAPSVDDTGSRGKQFEAVVDGGLFNPIPTTEHKDLHNNRIHLGVYALMPEMRPLVGEIWELKMSPGHPARGVVCSVTEERVVLLSQIGRGATVPLRSFLLTWSFVRSPDVETSCSYSGCRSVGCVQVRSLGSWHWVCPDHIPPGVDFRFDPHSRSRPPALECCPSCEKTSTILESREIAGRFLMHSCNRCGARWVLLVGRGIPQEGLWVAEAIRDIVRAFDSLNLREYRCFMGPTVLASVNSLPGGNSEAPTLSSIPVTMTLKFGSDQTMIMAKGPVIEALSPPDSPALGSVWWDRATRKPVRVISREYKDLEFQVSFRQGRNTQTLSIEDFHRVFHNVPPTVDTGPVEIGSLWTYMGSFHRVLSISGKNITLGDGDGKAPLTVKEEVLRKQWVRVHVKGSMERLLEDDPF